MRKLMNKDNNDKKKKILSKHCIYHDDVKTIVLHAYCKYTTVF